MPGIRIPGLSVKVQESRLLAALAHDLPPVAPLANQLLLSTEAPEDLEGLGGQ